MPTPSRPDVNPLPVAAPWQPRVLVADDDAIDRFAADQLLQSLGFTVDVVGSGQEAVELSARWPYVAIFMDCSMPELDGYGATRKIHSHDGRSRHTLVIAMTSHPWSVAIASGMDYHLAKPLTVDLLRAELPGLGLVPRDGIRPSEPSEMPSAGTPLLEPSSLEEIARGDRTRAAARMDEFIWDATARLPELWRAANAGDLAALHRLAEDLKPRAAYVGAARVTELSRRLGNAAAGGSTTLAAGIARSLPRALQDTSEAIRDYVDAGAAGNPPAVKTGDADRRKASGDVNEPEPEAAIRVAIADDDPLALFAVQAMIERAAGLELVGAADGVEQIVDLVAHARPEVVVLDWMMPGGGGPEAARRILYQTPDTVIIALTASTSPESAAEMKSAGASRVLTKGHSANTLEDTIRQVLRTKGVGLPRP